MIPIYFPGQNVWILCAYFFFGAGRLRVVIFIQVVYDKSALVLWFLHKISLQVVKEANGVDGCACSEIGKELELAKSSHLLYAVF